MVQTHRCEHDSLWSAGAGEPVSRPGRGTLPASAWRFMTLRGSLAGRICHA
jgi:hypothetical protein